MLTFSKEGYLEDASLWTETLAIEIAQQEAIILTSQHWQILQALRQFYQQYAIMPTMRAFLKYLQLLQTLHPIDRNQPQGSDR